MADFRADLTSLINRHSKENASNTPDWILADYLMVCLAAFDTATQQRETWYGRDARPSATKPTADTGRPLETPAAFNPGAPNGPTTQGYSYKED